MPPATLYTPSLTHVSSTPLIPLYQFLWLLTLSFFVRRRRDSLLSLGDNVGRPRQESATERRVDIITLVSLSAAPQFHPVSIVRDDILISVAADIGGQPGGQLGLLGGLTGGRHRLAVLDLVDDGLLSPLGAAGSKFLRQVIRIPEMEFLNGIFSRGFWGINSSLLRLEFLPGFLPSFSVLQNAIHE
jgi:hypothetical protein